MTRDDLLEEIERTWRQVADIVESMELAGLQAAGADGWSVKDHLTHLAGWERSLIALLSGEDRAAAMGIEDKVDAEVDEQNEALRQVHASLGPEDALRLFRQTHAELIARLGGLGDHELQLPYSHFQPDDRGPNRDQPVLGWILGNTTEHYEEHLPWIQAVTSTEAANS